MIIPLNLYPGFNFRRDLMYFDDEVKHIIISKNLKSVYTLFISSDEMERNRFLRIYEKLNNKCKTLIKQRLEEILNNNQAFDILLRQDDSPEYKSIEKSILDISSEEWNKIHSVVVE